MYKQHQECRACGYGAITVPGGIKSAAPTDRLVPVFSLGAQPLANDFKAPGEVCAGFAPLDVLYCPRCTLAQLSVVVDPKVLYQHYAYVTSASQTMQNHFRRLWHDLCVDAGRELGTVIEIGSNDGKLLKFLKDEHKVNGVGIDPAENLAKASQAAGVTTVVGFFDADTQTEALKLLEGTPDCILARHVLCHLDDWVSFMRLVAGMCGPQTLVAIEVPNAMDLVNGMQFDTIYHEHLSYMSVRAMEYLVLRSGSGLQLTNVHQYPLHGGAMVLVLRATGTSPPPSDLPSPSLADWQRLKAQADSKIQQMTGIVTALRHLGKRVAGFGASAKSTVWMSACRFHASQIDFIADNTPGKQWKHSPGSNIPIMDEGALLRELPDFAIMFAWNYRSEILKAQSCYLKHGGHFIVPIPQLDLV